MFQILLMSFLNYKRVKIIYGKILKMIYGKTNMIFKLLMIQRFQIHISVSMALRIPIVG